MVSQRSGVWERGTTVHHETTPSAYTYIRKWTPTTKEGTCLQQRAEEAGDEVGHAEVVQGVLHVGEVGPLGPKGAAGLVVVLGLRVVAGVGVFGVCSI